MNIGVLKHVHFEGLGFIEEWGNNNKFNFNIYELYQEEILPIPDQIDFLIILGGPMSANSTEYHWLKNERALIKDLIKLGKPILGVCLGAQQIAKALDASVYQGEFKEVGWHTIKSTTSSFDFIPNEMTVFHWHGEQFEIPRGAQKLFSSKACVNQGFIYNNNVVGLQFHFESTEETIEKLLENDSEYIDQSKHVQTISEIKNYPIPFENKEVLFNLMNYMLNYKRSG